MTIHFLSVFGPSYDLSDSRVCLSTCQNRRVFYLKNFIQKQLI